MKDDDDDDDRRRNKERKKNRQTDRQKGLIYNTVILV